MLLKETFSWVTFLDISHHAAATPAPLSAWWWGAGGGRRWWPGPIAVSGLHLEHLDSGVYRILAWLSPLQCFVLLLFPLHGKQQFLVTAEHFSVSLEGRSVKWKLSGIDFCLTWINGWRKQVPLLIFQKQGFIYLYLFILQHKGNLLLPSDYNERKQNQIWRDIVCLWSEMECWWVRLQPDKILSFLTVTWMLLYIIMLL